MLKFSRILFCAAMLLFSTCAFAAFDGKYEIKSLIIKDKIGSKVIDSKSKMQVFTFQGEATIKSGYNTTAIGYKANMQGVFRANPNLSKYSEIYDLREMRQDEFQISSDIDENAEEIITVVMPFESDKKLFMKLKRK